MTQTGIGALASAALWLCAANASARAPEVYLSWQRPAGSLCPSRDVLIADVEALMERDVFTSEAEARVRVRGVVDDDANGVRVHIEAIGAHGEPLGMRELTAPAGQCASIRDAIALVLTLFIEYEAPANERTDLVFGLGGEIGLAQAPMPRLAWSVGPTLSLAIERALELYLGAAYWPAVAIKTARGTGAELTAVSAELRACVRPWRGLGVCGGLESGALMAVPLELEGPERQTRLLAHALLEVSYRLELARMLLVDLAGGGLVSLSRPSFSYLRADGDEMAVYRPDLAGVNFRLTIIIPTE